MKLVDIHTDDTVSYLDVIRRAVTNVDVFVSNPGADPSDWVMRGEPLEQALLQKAELEGISQKKERDRYHSFKRIPFDAERKFSAFVGWHEDGSAQIDILGAPEIVIHYTDLDPDRKQQIIEHISHEARNGARVLMLASANVGSCSKDSIDSCFENTVFTYYGVLSFRDPIRMSVRNSIIRITEGGVRTVIVTGDHKGTALYVAKELGIVTHENQACDSSDIDDMTDEQLMNATEHIRVFARATPTQKVRILQAFKKRGEIVAVTGDGVNDAPVLKTANIGVAMGSGTDVAKSASDLIILDDNYETIVSAIEEGRIIVDNLRKVIIFLLSDSFDELILIGGAILFNVGLPLTAIQILFVKVFTDTLPALSFPFDRGDHALQRDPTKIRSSLFDFETKVFTIGRGLFSAVFLFGLYYVLLQYTQIDDAVVRTFVFASFSTYILFLVFPLRSIDLNIWEFNPFSNWYINIAVILGFVMTLLAIYQPWLRDMLGTTYLPMHYMIGVIGVGISNVISMELLKLWFKNKKNT